MISQDHSVSHSPSLDIDMGCPSGSTVLAAPTRSQEDIDHA